jgi:hypothetical protein
MGDPAVDIEKDPLAIEGLEEVFTQDGPDENFQKNSSVQYSPEDSPGSVLDGSARLVHPISVEDAAGILNISTNAICKRLRKGSLVGVKIPGKFKDEWLVEGAGLIEVLKVDFDKVQDSPEEFSDDRSSVQDQTEISPGSVQNSPEPSVTRLLDLVEKQAAKLEAAAGQIGYLQAQLESQALLNAEKENQIKLLTDSQVKHGAWSRFWGWFTGVGR